MLDDIPVQQIPNLIGDRRAITPNKFFNRNSPPRRANSAPKFFHDSYLQSKVSDPLASKRKTRRFENRHLIGLSSLILNKKLPHDILEIDEDLPFIIISDTSFSEILKSKNFDALNFYLSCQELNLTDHLSIKRRFKSQAELSWMNVESKLRRIAIESIKIPSFLEFIIEMEKIVIYFANFHEIYHDENSSNDSSNELSEMMSICEGKLIIKLLKCPLKRSLVHTICQYHGLNSISSTPKSSKKLKDKDIIISSKKSNKLFGHDLLDSFRILDKSGKVNTSADYFQPYNPSFVGIYGDPNNFQRERVNEGSPQSADQEILFEGQAPRQVCPGMIGPFSDGNYYCTAREYGYCDKRSGTCFCNVGYEGIDCSRCQPSHFKDENGYLCYPKKLCPNDCSGAGVCDHWTGTCQCLPHRDGVQCEILLCSKYHPLCESCNEFSCNLCSEGYYLTGDASVCRTCYDFDPRCAGCTKDQGCTVCADPLLTSVRRSGYRASDPSLPLEESTRELSITIPFGSKSPEAFADAEIYSVVSSSAQQLNYSSQSCSQGLSNDDTWKCSSFQATHKVCGHKGVFRFSYPNYVVNENVEYLRVSVIRSGGGYGNVTISYFLVHYTTDDSDVSPTARYTSNQLLSFEAGVVERTFLITIFDDNVVEENEVFQLVLEVPEGGGSVNAQFRANVTIIDDDKYKLSPKLTYMLKNTSHAKAGAQFTVDLKAVNSLGDPMSSNSELFHAILENDNSMWKRYNQRHTTRKVVPYAHLANGLYRFTGSINEAGFYQLKVMHSFPNGLRGDYFSDGFFQKLALSRIDRYVNFTWGTGRIIPRGSDYISIRWTGVLKAAWGLTYFKINADDHARLWINGDLKIDHWHEQEVYREPARAVNLVVGSLYEIILEYREVRESAYISLLWGSSISSMSAIPPANLFSLYEVNISPVFINVSSAATDPAKSECTGEGLFSGTVNNVSYFHIYPRDTYRNLREDDNLFFLSTQIFRAKLTLTNGAQYDGVGNHLITPILRYDSHLHRFTGTYKPEIAGSYFLEITYQSSPDATSLHVLGSPFTVNIYPTNTFGPYSRVYGIPSVLNAVAGVCYTFTIVARDTSRNLVLKGGDNFQVYTYRVNFNKNAKGVLPPGNQPTAQPTAVPTTASQFAGIDSMSPASDTYEVFRYGTVTDLKNGNYTGKVCPVIAGLHEIHILLNAYGVSNQNERIMERVISGKAVDMGGGAFQGQYVHDSPYSLYVTSAGANPKSCSAEGKGLVSAVVGVPVAFMVTIRDSWDNVVKNVLTSQLTASILQTPGAVVNLWNYLNGSIQVEYTAKLAGINDVAVYVNGKHILSSPFKVKFIDGAISPKFTYSRGKGLKVGTAGVPSFFELFAFDLENNSENKSSTVFTYSISGANSLSGNLLPCPVSDSSGTSYVCDESYGVNGHYYAIFTPTYRGTIQIDVYLKHNASSTSPLQESPYFAYINSASPKAENTIVLGTLYDNVAGTDAFVDLQLKDEFFNDLEFGGREIELALLCVAQEWGTINTLANPRPGNVGATPNSYHYQGFFAGLPRYYGDCIDREDGSYICKYNIPSTGQYVLRVSIEEPGLNATYFNSTDMGHLSNFDFNNDALTAELMGDPINLGNTISWTGDISGAQGLNGQRKFGSYFDKFKSRVENDINFNWSIPASSPVKWNYESYTPFSNFDTVTSLGYNQSKFRQEYWSVRYTGRIFPSYAEEYIFSMILDSSSEVRLYLGGRGFAINSSDDDSRKLVFKANSSASVKGVYHFSDTSPRDFMLEYIHRSGPSYATLYWQSPSTPYQVVPKEAFTHWRNATHRNLTIHPNTLSPHHSTAYGKALYTATVARLESFLVYARDEFGNLLQYGGHVPSMLAVGRDGVTFRGRVTDYLNSTYLIEYEPMDAGDFLMYVTMGCCPPHPNVGFMAELDLISDLLIMKAPFHLKISPAVIEPARCIVTGQGATGGVAGELLYFSILFRDIFNNPTSDTRIKAMKNGTLGYALTKDDFDVKFYRKVFVNSSFNFFLVNPQHYEIVLLPESVKITYALKNSGDYDLKININGISVVGKPYSISTTSIAPTTTNVLGSPYKLYIYPSKADPAQTVCRGLGLKQAFVNQSISFEINLFDTFSNSLIVGGNTFYIRVFGDATHPLSPLPISIERNSLVSNPIVQSDAVIPNCIDNQNGKYLCSYSPKYPGPHELQIKLLNYSTSEPGGNGLHVKYMTKTSSFESQFDNVKLVESENFDKEFSYSWPTGLTFFKDKYSSSVSKLSGQYIEWSGYITFPRSDVFFFQVETNRLNVSIYVENELVFDNVLNISAKFSSLQGPAYKIYLDARINPEDIHSSLYLRVFWGTSSMPVSLISKFFLFDEAFEIIASPFSIKV